MISEEEEIKQKSLVGSKAWQDNQELDNIIGCEATGEHEVDEWNTVKPRKYSDKPKIHHDKFKNSKKIKKR